MKYFTKQDTFWVILFVTLGLTACQSAPPIKQVSGPILQDDAFPRASDIRIESEKDIFRLDKEARAYVQKTVGRIKDPIERTETLARNIFERLDFDLLYRGDANTTANETFYNKTANCLSLSIMTYAMATEAGLGARFQDVKVPEYWTRREGVSLLNGHINLQIVPRERSSNSFYVYNKGYQIDFNPQTAKEHFIKTELSKNQVIAMFYNNKGADALLNNDRDRAYAYFAAALKVEPNFDSALVNLGFLYRVSKLYELSENVYLHALSSSPDNLTAWENLAYLYAHSGKPEQSAAILARVQSKRLRNPYYHLDLGRRDFDLGKLQQALTHFNRALAIDGSRHEIFYALAKTYYALGEVVETERYLKKAKRKTKNLQEKELYQGELDLLTRS
ncbi:transglutaminase-like domain-containing protein [Paraglaciecola sp. L1A13]|uniref:transglutaminase-like domain-containing protein n=1 Tax=Paraglaciecola sp. L1A13 TaxID=2686359 RepID=UPI00131A67EB|nr:transglutaminase-like domain-containing protein [Paraglaciecola sp. L1A13]